MSYYTTVLSDSPISYWLLDEAAGGTASDVKDGNVGSYQGGFTLQQPGPGTGNGIFGVLFNGTTGYVNCGTAANLNLSRGFSLEALVKTAATTGAIASHGSGSWYIRVGGGHLDFLKSQTGSIVTGTITINDNAWHHVVVTVDASGNVVLYVDGVVDVTTTTAQTFTATQVATIGRDTTGASAGADFLTGTISNVAVYNTALSAARVTAHYGAISTTASPAGRVTQVGALAVAVGTPKVRITQAGVLAVSSAVPKGRVTQSGILVVTPNLAYKLINPAAILMPGP
jgi:hypothetical protein